jgi:hypothetical protein
MINVEQSVGWLAGETEVLTENLPLYHFVHHKSHTTGSNPGYRLEKPATNRLRLSVAECTISLRAWQA